MKRKLYYIVILTAFVAFGLWYYANYSNIKSLHNENISNNGKDSIDKTQISSENIYSEYNEKININTANEAELSSIDGIGPKRAADIVEYRKTKGDFKHIEDIMNVSGIGEGTFNTIKNHITV